MQSEREEKIRLFARLLTAAARGEPGTDLSDDFDQFQNILIDLSPRELAILLVIDEVETNHYARVGDGKGKPSNSAYEEALVLKIGLVQEVVWPTISRLARTGLCSSDMPYVVTLGSTDTYLTPLYHRFAEWVRLKGMLIVVNKNDADSSEEGPPMPQWEIGVQVRVEAATPDEANA